MLKLMLVGGITGVFSLFISFPVHGQIEVGTPPQFFESEHSEISPLELRQFAQILKEFREIDYRTQRKMAIIIKKGGLSYERFMEIGQSHKNYNYVTGLQASREELEKFQKTLSEVEEIIANTEQKKDRIVHSQGLEIKRFQEIEAIISQDPQLQKKVQQMVGN